MIGWIDWQKTIRWLLHIFFNWKFNVKTTSIFRIFKKTEIMYNCSMHYSTRNPLKEQREIFNSESNEENVQVAIKWYLRLVWWCYIWLCKFVWHGEVDYTTISIFVILPPAAELTSNSDINLWLWHTKESTAHFLYSHIHPCKFLQQSEELFTKNEQFFSYFRTWI